MTPVDSLATGFDLEAHRRRRRIAAVSGTICSLICGDLQCLCRPCIMGGKEFHKQHSKILLKVSDTKKTGHKMLDMIEVFKITHNIYDPEVSPELRYYPKSNTRGNKYKLLIIRSTTIHENILLLPV